MATVYIQSEIEKKLQQICDSQQIKMSDLVNDILECHMKSGQTKSEELDQERKIEQLILELLQYSSRDQRRFLALYDQYTCDIKGQPEMLERLKKI